MRQVRVWVRLHIAGVCNVDTPERIAKKAAADVMMAVLQGLAGGLAQAGVPTVAPYVHDPLLAKATASTYLKMAIIDGRSSEVLHVARMTLGDCTKPEQFEAELASVAQRLGTKVAGSK